MRMRGRQIAGRYFGARDSKVQPSEDLTKSKELEEAGGLAALPGAGAEAAAAGAIEPAEAAAVLKNKAGLPVTIKEKVYTTFEDPSYSFFAKVWSIFMILLILLSTCCFVLETEAEADFGMIPRQPAMVAPRHASNGPTSLCCVCLLASSRVAARRCSVCRAVPPDSALFLSLPSATRDPLFLAPCAVLPRRPGHSNAAPRNGWPTLRREWHRALCSTFASSPVHSPVHSRRGCLLCPPPWQSFFTTVEWFSVICFTFEYCIRFASAPEPRKFFFDMLNLVDLCAWLPFWLSVYLDSTSSSSGGGYASPPPPVSLIYPPYIPFPSPPLPFSPPFMPPYPGAPPLTARISPLMPPWPPTMPEATPFVSEEEEGFQGLGFLRAIRLFRVSRLFKFGRYSVGIQMFGGALKSSAQSMLILVVMLTIAMIILSSAIYLVEEDASDSVLAASGMSRASQNFCFGTIPNAFWCAVPVDASLQLGGAPCSPLERVTRPPSYPCSARITG